MDLWLLRGGWPLEGIDFVVALRHPGRAAVMAAEVVATSAASGPITTAVEPR